MASKGKERENFFRICILVVDHIKNALVEMFKYYLREYKEDMSFEKFIDEHMTDIRYLKNSNILYPEEVDKLIVDDKAKSGLKVDVLEVTLVRRLLDNLCPDLFMGGCKALHDFLKKNQHDIYHLFKFNEPCCQCSQDYKFPVISPLLSEGQYKKMFKLSPCTNCTGTNGTVCSGSSCIVTEDIKLDIKFNYTIKKVVFGHFSPIFKAMLKFTEIRNNAYGHADATVIPNVIYDVYKKDIEENIMVLARICGNEDETRLALDDVQTRSYDETLCKQYMISLSEQVKRDIELMEGIGENRQILQEISQQLQELNEQLRNLKAKDTNITKDVGVSCGVIVGMQETNSLTSTPSSGNQSSQFTILLNAQLNVHSQTQQHQLDDRSLEHQNPQTLNNDIPSTSTQLPILGIQNLMNQTNNIERNSLERGHGQQVAVVASGGLMRNSEPQNLHSSVNPTDDQAGALTSCSPESSSNNISTGNDQRGQGYQSSIGTDAEPFASSVNNERVHDREKKRDGVVLHVEKDRVAAKEFMKNMEEENPGLDIGIISYDNLLAGTSRLRSAANVFHSYNYLFIFVTQNFIEADLEMYFSEIALVETLEKPEKRERLIPVKTKKTCDHPMLTPLHPLKYYHYLEAKTLQLEPDQDFIKCFRDLITNGRKKYLVS